MDELRVAVIGAGIAGLTVAAGLARVGRDCVVYERAERSVEPGAGIQLSPNGARLLHRLGLAEQLHAVATRPEAIELRRWDDNAVLATTPLGAACVKMFDAPYYTLHRADLHRALRDLVADRIRKGRDCVGLTEATDGVELHFADGATESAGLVVGADGVRSVVRGHLVADRPRPSGVTVYRGLIPGRRLPRRMADPRIVIWLGPSRHCVSYPAGQWVSFVATVPGQRWRSESWVEPGAVAELVAGYAGWHREVLELLGAAASVSRWALHDRAPLARWCTRRTALAGDAAHAMLPFGGQGANQAVEDAFALVACLTDAAPPASALQRYERVRQARVARVSASVREHAVDHHIADGAAQRVRDDGLGRRRGLAEQGWLYGYDAELAVRP